jgi:tRNA(Phe) wybutosine-synthesizing methylase Tyw3
VPKFTPHTLTQSLSDTKIVVRGSGRLRVHTLLESDLQDAVRFVNDEALEVLVYESARILSQNQRQRRGQRQRNIKLDSYCRHDREESQ